MIRKASQSDIPALVNLCIEALSIDPYSELVIDRAKVYEAVKECVISASNFAWVSENKEGLQGALGAIVLPMMVYERSQCQVVMWYSKIHGDGLKLLNQFLAWTKSRMMIKQIIYSPDRIHNPLIAKIMKRAGFQDSAPTFVMTR